ncbi:MAG TPA: hypothetical protein VK206_12495 [Anaerolineales bacterium]|nr:hypothetical protein [Anaerolineales bacterium]HLO30145.1 hypothetical protein [Anaerolineales bacterium]
MEASRIKLLSWFIILTLSIGCVPSLSTPTPIPPLDPNAINLIIGQTAEAAAAQTLAAMPPSTITPTITLTPRSTFTPEPTFTPIGTFSIPSPTPVTSFLYYRVKHDNQLASNNYKSRTFDENSEDIRDQTPETVPLFVLPKLGSGTARTKVDGAWEIFIDTLNENDPVKLRYLKSDSTALFNTAGFPQLQSLTMGGNIIRLDAVQNGWGRVVTMDYGSPPNAAEVNYVTRPDLIHKFVVVGWKRSTKTTIWVNPPKGDLYWPLVTRRTVWIQMERVEPFPILPMTVTANSDLYIQPEPGPKIEQTKIQLSAGESAQVIAYYPSGSNVWGRVQRGWIPLLIYPHYLTSWTMETMSPPP